MRRRDVLMGIGAAVVAGCGRGDGLAAPIQAPGVARQRRADVLAASGARLGWLRGGALDLLGWDGGAGPSVPLAQGLGLTAVVGGFVVLERDGDALVAVRASAAGEVTREPTWIPLETEPVALWADPADPLGLWVVSGTSDSALHHAPGGTHPKLSERPLSNSARSDVAGLPDGAFLLADSGGLRRVSADGKGQIVAWRPPAVIERLCAGPTPGTALALDVQGGMSLVDLGSGAARWTAALGGQGMALAADASGVLALTGTRIAGGVPRWTLTALDTAGAQRWQVHGEGEPGRSLALGASAVALGDAGQLRIWARETGATVRG